MTNSDNSKSLEGIAIIGLSGRFPGAKNVDEFWQNLKNGVESISFFSEEELEAEGIDRNLLKKSNYIKARAVLEDIDLFDASFFGFNPREAEITDPQHRLFLECAWESLETAGYNPETYSGSIGVYAGTGGINTYFLNNLYSNRSLREQVGDYQLYIGNDKDFLPTRVSYKLNLKGPSVTVQTACSTSLVATSMACQSLLNYQCDIALAGGVSISVPQKTGYFYREGMILSPDGHCRAFDARAKGTVSGSGVGIVVLKRLEDAVADGDYIHAVIKGSGINNDGSLKVGYTAPSVEGQAEAIAQALAFADIEPETISYIEAHGTGTPLGDPIEIAALTQAFRDSTEKKEFCAIGSLKTNIGHLDTAAGIAGLIKTVQALKHELIPPSLHFEEPNPQIDFDNSPFYVNTTLSQWKTDGFPRRAGVSSFGIGGTNAHVVLEEAPVVEASGESRPWQLLVLSAKTQSALDTSTQNLADYLDEHPDRNLADVAYTLQVGRKAFGHRRIVVCRDRADAVAALSALAPKQVFTHFQDTTDRSVVFMFSGQGSQYVNMGLELYGVESTFREQIDRCSELLEPHLGLDLRDILYPSPDRVEEAREQLKQTAITQPALFAIEYALAQLWMSWGIHPVAAIGHSIGEYVAACIAGVFSLEDALSLVAKRGQLMQQMPPGAMLAVPLPEEQVQDKMRSLTSVQVAVINTPSSCVVSGPFDAIDVLQQELLEEGVECRRLHTSHAFHSQMMDPILDPFTEQVKKIHLNPPKIPCISNVTGTWMTAAEATNPQYWAKHLRQTVRFAKGVQELFKQPDRILLEVGPGRTLSALARQHPDKAAQQLVFTSLRHPQEQQSDVAFLLTTLGKLWSVGVKVDWFGFYAEEQRYRLPLPTYPFERQRYWIESQQQVNEVSDRPVLLSEMQRSQEVEFSSFHQRPSLQNAYVAPRNELERKIAEIWKVLLGIEQVGIHDDFFELGGDSLQGLQLIQKLRETLQVELSLNHLLEAPNIAALAALIANTTSLREIAIAKTDSTLPSPLVPIRSTGSKSPFFWVHPIGGNVLCYANLARYLDPERPFYGLQARGLDGERSPLTRFEDMAADYIKAIRVIQPEGSYFFGGWSLGGSIAFEMAQQLQKEGDRVDFLVWLDSGRKPIHGKQVEELLGSIVDDASMLAWFATDLAATSGQKVLLSVDRLRQMNRDEQLLYLLEEAKKVNIFPSTTEVEDIRPLVQVFLANFQALYDYVPPVYSNRLTLFLDRESLSNHPPDAPDPALGWGELSTQPIDIHVVPGNHYTMLSEPNLQVVAEQLQRCLDNLNPAEERS